MYAQSFMAHDPEGRLIAADSAQRHPGNHYTCHLCGSPLRLHREANPAWFEHVTTHLTDNGVSIAPMCILTPKKLRSSVCCEPVYQKSGRCFTKGIGTAQRVAMIIMVNATA